MDILSLNIIDKGGLMMWPMIFISLLGLMFTIERAIYLHKGKIRAAEFLAGIKNLLEKNRLVEALTVCEETSTPVSNVIKAALLSHDQPEEKMEAAVEAAAFAEMPNLQRRLGTIAMIARIAPLMGLIGTVISIYLAISALEVEGNFVNAAILSKFIIQALIATATGLVIAMIAWIIHHFLEGRVKSIVHDMEWVAHDILQFLLSDAPKQMLEEKAI